jgi:hypothetical protein
MTQIKSLIKSAKEASTWRGHKMERFNHNEDGKRAYSKCSCCGMTVVVNTRPMPNDIDICGEAVALNCK